MTSTSTKTIAIILIMLFTIGNVSATHHQFQDNLHQETGFDIPQYDSQEEILYELVAPFIFLTIILHLGYSKVLHAIFKDEEARPYMAPPMVMVENDPKPDVRRYAMLMSITTTAIMIPTSLWTYVRFVTLSIPTLALSIILIVFLYGSYKTLTRLL